MKFTMYTSIAVGALVLTGCQSTLSDKEKEIASLEAKLETKNQNIDRLNQGSEEKDLQIDRLRAQIAQTQVSEDYPKNARDGQCFAKVMTPPKYEMKQVKVKTRDSSTAIKVIPAQYRWVEKRVEVVPESTRVVKVAAQYANVSERVLIQKEHSVWKKTKDASGNVSMCKVKVPAKHRVVTRRVESKPASTKKIIVPAEYKSVRVKELVSEESQAIKVIPATYKTLKRRVLVDEGSVSWSEIVCNENAPRASIVRIQRSLKARGYNPGHIDGIIGDDTLGAVDRYQRNQRLARGALTKETVESLLTAH